MRSIVAASVEDFPDPVGPVTSTIPFFNDAISSRLGGRPRVANVGIVFGTTRITMACVPRCLNMLTRNLDNPGRLKDRSAEPHCSRESAAILLLPIKAWAIAAVWAGVN